MKTIPENFDMTLFVATFLDVRAQAQVRASGYSTAIGTSETIAKHLADNEFKVLVASMVITAEDVNVLERAEYRVL